MKPDGANRLSAIMGTFHAELLAAWMADLSRSGGRLTAGSTGAESRDQGGEFLQLLTQAIQAGNTSNIQDAAWKPLREMLATLSRTRGVRGASPSETASFVFSLKKPLFAILGREIGDSAQASQEIQVASDLLDQLGLYTTEMHQKAREEVISRQQEEMLELSTPVVKLWEGILALPMIGTLDSSRTQVVMESLLQKIVETGSSVAILDITGVPTVDTLTAQHLLKTVTAARLMGAFCIISGIRPQIAQTIVHLGVDLGNVITKSSLADAFALALRRTGRTVTKLPAAAPTLTGEGY